MTTLFRLVLWAVWCGAMGWLWSAQMMGAGMALTAGALGLGLFAWPGSTTRRRRGGELRYVEMAKQPIS
ncbi:hypothetical protein [Variovorax sp. OV329]|uniref:hypothetical protein n=1 Tax=Variovorax sp. OV329 TaxID=1882825 RepID=UPI000B85272A|nr:hypothetical protein [Variovorax sp. OV329]